MRSTTFTTRIFSSGRCSRIIETAASVSSVGTSPQQAMTTSGANVLVVAGPLPDADSLGAVLDGGIHRQPLRRRVFARDHDVDIMAAAQAVVHHRKQAVRIRRKVDAHDLGLLVHDVVDETGVLVGEAVVILAPDMRGQKIV